MTHTERVREYTRAIIRAYVANGEPGDGTDTATWQIDRITKEACEDVSRIEQGSREVPR